MSSDENQKYEMLPEPSDARKSVEELYLSSIPNRASKNVKRLKLETDLSTQQLAEVSEISLAALKQIESGRRRMMIPHAMMIARATGVDVVSLLIGELLLEWGGGEPYKPSSYSDWLNNGNTPSPEQEKNCRKQVENLCSHIKDDLEVGPIGDAFLGAHLYVLLGGIEPEVLYSGISA